MGIRSGQIVGNNEKDPRILSAGGATSPLLSGLVHYWTMDEASGTRADPVGGATLNDSNTVGSGAGINNNAALFAAASLESLYESTINPGDTDFAFSVWIKPATLTTQVVLARDGATARSFLLDIESNKPKFYILPSSNAATSLVSVTAGSWFHIYAVHDSVNNIVGVSVNNETLVTTATTGAPSSTAGQPFRVGARDTGGSPLYFDGSIDELGMWSRTLTTEERTALYNSGVGRFYPVF